MSRASAAVLACSIALALAAAELRAQEDAPRVGLTMGYPSGVGLVWHATDRIGVRPELSFSRTSSSTEAGGFGLELDVSSDRWQIGAGVTGLFYLTRADGLRTYAAPRYTYHRADGGETASTGHGIAGLFGAQYTLNPRFMVFGETGLSYSRSRFSADSVLPIRTEVRGNSVGVTSGAGVVLYF